MLAYSWRGRRRVKVAVGVKDGIGELGTLRLSAAEKRAGEWLNAKTKTACIAASRFA